MDKNLQNAHISGVERMTAWAGLLDRINVFPVADGDTGRNLTISLSPLRQIDKNSSGIINKLLASACGNSGNIAVRFLSGFLTADSIQTMPEAAALGRAYARQSIRDPKPGTMLTVFDALVNILENLSGDYSPESIAKIIVHLETAVKSTPELLPPLKAAGVVDSGALGMYIYLEGFWAELMDGIHEFRPLSDVFKNMLQVNSASLPPPLFFKERGLGGEFVTERFCVDTTISFNGNAEDTIQTIAGYGESVVLIPNKNQVKVHLHTDNIQDLRKKIESLGKIIQWSDEDIAKQEQDFKKQPIRQAIHIMTDAAGSVTLEDAHTFGITLLDSCILAGDKCLPETLFNPAELYACMKNGIRVSTSQASVFERHQHYQSVLAQYDKILYLCVGSVYTGNYDVVMEWKKKYDHDDRLTVLDTGAASGRLGTIAIAAARYSCQVNSPDAVIAFAKTAIDRCEEYIFPDRLHYLAAGGRVSGISAFVGDMLCMKPVISPLPQGAKKIAVVRNQKEQLEFALKKLEAAVSNNSSSLIMLQYSDNRSWVTDMVKKEIEKQHRFADIIIQPLSLTSGAHLGPGTWAVAFLPERTAALKEHSSTNDNPNP